MSSVIEVKNLSKAYQLGEFSTGTLTQDLERWWLRRIGKEDKFLKIGEENERAIIGNSNMIWSLKDINLNIIQGETVGIIGRNGAGKSTLLKILSRVTTPTTGSVRIKGRIASLLEVGTGFHPELTGRENIFLNGAILGMRKQEIKAKFDEIVDFSGVERYIDTPVKRYSSGMYVRLAFAVAAFLEPEILIVDEVLAVGDAEFQKKCLGRMREVSTNQGRTVIFVSHNMAAVNQLCSRTAYLVNGIIHQIGETARVISNYLSTGAATEATVNLKGLTANRSGNLKVEFIEITLKKSEASGPMRLFSIGDSIHINFTVRFINPNERNVKTSIELKTSEGLKIANMIDVDSGFQVQFSERELVSFEVILHDLRLYPDTYYLSLYAGDMSSTEAYDYVEDCISFEVIDGGKLTSRTLPKIAGLLFLTPEWKTKSV